MHLNILKKLLFLGGISLIPFSSYASSLEEFTAMQGRGTKITKNPASLASLRGQIFNFENFLPWGSACAASYFETKNIKPHESACSSPTQSSDGEEFGTNTGVLRVNYADDGSGRNAFVDMAADLGGFPNGDSGSDIKYKLKDSLSTSWAWGIGGDSVSFAFIPSQNYEWYSQGRLVDASGRSLSTSNTLATESIYRTEQSTLLAFTLPSFLGLKSVSIGVRNNAAKRYHEYSADNATNGSYKLSGKATENSLDYGILIPDIAGKFGLGYVQRLFSNKNDTDFIMAYKQVSSTAGDTGKPYREIAYSTDPYRSLGVVFKFNSFSLPTKILLDWGGIEKQSQEIAAGLSLKWAASNINYGVRETEYGDFKLRKETVELQFSGMQLKLTTYIFFVSSGGGYKEVGKINIPSASFSVKFGGGGGRNSAEPYNETYCNSPTESDCVN